MPARSEFEVASVRKARADGIPNWVNIFPGGRLQGETTLQGFITYAYRLQPFQRIVSASPLLQDRFAIIAKVPETLSSIVDVHRLMLQTLLAERFGLAFHFEDQIQTVYVIRRGSDALSPNLNRAECFDGGYAR